MKGQRQLASRDSSTDPALNLVVLQYHGTSVLADVKFSARHSAGSAVMFGAEDDVSAGKIVLHRTHHMSKMDPIMFPSMRIGWERNAFCHQDKAYSMSAI